MTPPHARRRPVVWSVAGVDPGGGAGLAADLRAAEALGAHLCPVVAALTAQNSVSVQAVQATSTELFDAQLAALASDIRPRAIKVGLLASAEQAQVLAKWVDRLRDTLPLALVVDPVLGASSGARFAGPELLAAYRQHLIPRATLITPNRAEASELVGDGAEADAAHWAQALRALGAQGVCITGGDAASEGLALDWLDTPHAQGWLALPRVGSAHTHGTGCTFSTLAASALALGYTSAAACVLAKMGTTDAIRRGLPVGAGAGAVQVSKGFACDPTLLPILSVGSQAPDAWPPRLGLRGPGLYAIVESAARAQAVLQAASGVETIQLRIKRPADLDDAQWQALLSREIADARRACIQYGVVLYINDHWREAIAAEAAGVHLGQEDVLALQPDELAQLRAAQGRGLRLGLSSHNLWELARAHGLQPSYIACGPVWPTTTKDMPWRPQGLGNLAWWAHMSPAPVVAIGGILEPAQLAACGAAGAHGACLVRALGKDDDLSLTLPTWLAAWQRGCAEPGHAVPPLPHPSLTDPLPLCD